MPALRSGAWRRIAAGALLCGALELSASASDAASASFDVGDGVVVQVIGKVAAVTIRTWNRDTVEVQWPDGEPFESTRTVQRTRPSFLIPTVIVPEYRTPAGPVMATLLPEDFPVPRLEPGMHDVIRIVETGAEPGRPTGTTLSVMIPQSTGLVNVRSVTGAIVMRDYHGTAIVADGRGTVTMRNVGGDFFVQPLNGRFYAQQADFDRLRIRSNHAAEVFDACRVKQIEATTLTGTILFDNGTFDVGLARFESDRGAIALGVNGGAQLGAHTQHGRVLTAFPDSRPAHPMFGDGDADDAPQLIGGGGPLVTAASVHGNVMLYDGSIAERNPQTLRGGWRRIFDLLVSERDALDPAADHAERGRRSR